MANSPYIPSIYLRSGRKATTKKCSKPPVDYLIETDLPAIFLKRCGINDVFSSVDATRSVRVMV